MRSAWDGEAVAAGGDETKRAFEAMMDMKKIDVAIKAARFSFASTCASA